MTESSFGVDRYEASIVGWGESTLGVVPDKDVYDLAEDAAYAALKRAGLRPGEVDGLCVAPPLSGVMTGPGIGASALAEHLGLMPGLKYGSLMSVGGASQLQHLAEAAMLVERGVCRNVLVMAVDSLVSELGPNQAIEIMADAGHPQYESPFGPLIPSMYALAARRHMAIHGTTPEQFAGVAELAYRHASLQPSHRSQSDEARSLDEILESPMVASPIRRDECSLLSDGGGAVVVTARERAHAEHELPVDVHSVGMFHTHESVHQMPDLAQSGLARVRDRFFSVSEMSVEDLDVIQIYDSFPITVLLQLEGLGFCEPGESGPLVESGALELDGRWPMNTHGGLIAQAHPGSPGGMFHLTEAVRQLRGEGGPTQVPECRSALVTGSGGVVSTQSVSILTRPR